ncbi:Uncharacterised protein [Candidatus Burarchaeum australiense]|nr:Uncharacterised protein [Candidatus Burarchaeum australiense]
MTGMKIVGLLVLLASLTLATSVERELVVSGSSASAMLTIQASSNVTGIIVTEIFPEGAVFSWGVPAPSKQSGNEYTWLLFDQALAAGKITYSFTNTQGNFTAEGSWKTVDEQGAVVNATAKKSQPAVRPQAPQPAPAPSAQFSFGAVEIIGALVLLALLLLIGLKLGRK